MEIKEILAAKDIKEAQKGIAFAAYLKLLMPLNTQSPFPKTHCVQRDADQTNVGLQHRH